MTATARLQTVDTIVGALSAFDPANPWPVQTGDQSGEPTKRTFSDPDQPWLRAVVEQTKSLAVLQEDWDGYGAGPIRKDVLWYALRLLQSIMDDYPAPQLSPMSHEGVLLEWHSDGVYLEIEIECAGWADVFYRNEKRGIDESWRVSSNFTSLAEPLSAVAVEMSASSTSPS